MADPFIGLWNIVQQNNINDIGTEYLSELNGQAARIPLNVGGRFVWEVTKPDNSPFYILALLASMPDPTPPPVLTLGGGVGGMEEMTILVGPPKPGYVDQLWKLVSVLDNLPNTLTAHIVPSEVPILTAATANRMPNPDQFVYAVPKQWPNQDRVWTFKRDERNQ